MKGAITIILFGTYLVFKSLDESWVQSLFFEIFYVMKGKAALYVGAFSPTVTERYTRKPSFGTFAVLARLSSTRTGGCEVVKRNRASAQFSFNR